MSTIATEFPGPTPQIVVANADAAINFYREAFGADELVRNHDANRRVMHAELLICGGRILILDDFDEDTVSSPTRLGATTVRLHLYVLDVDAAYQRAITAGATPVIAPEMTFWGDRYAVVQDPSGHHWSLATQLEDLSAAEQEQRADAWIRAKRAQR